MLYPVMPVYLQSIGFSIVIIGILEGFAEAAAGLSKGYFGKLSDQRQSRVPFIQAGYAFSAVSKPMMALFTYPAWIFLSRAIDRLGKGIRTGARDALLSDEAPSNVKAKVFGFHRSMDTLGAVIGPLFALVFLYYNPGEYRTLFFIAFVPGVLAIIATLVLKEKKPQHANDKKTISFFAFLPYWKQAGPGYRKLVAGLLLFTLINSSDVFLLLKAKQSGLDDTWVIGVYIFYNLIFAFFAFPAGILADNFGLKKIFIFGLLVYSLVYIGMSVNTNTYVFFLIFFLYGVYAAATEGISKAWIAKIADKNDTATAIGTYTGWQSICTLLASSITGFVWFRFGPPIAFLTTGILALGIAVYFLTVPGPSTRDIL